MDHATPFEPDYASFDREELIARLREADETLNAIRCGDVDAVVVGGPTGQQVYTLENADRPYRALIEQMQEGAVTLSATGAILYCNDRFAEIVDAARDTLIGHYAARYFRDGELAAFSALIADGDTWTSSAELNLTTTRGLSVPVNLSLIRLKIDDQDLPVICGVVTDLSLIRRRNDELIAANARLANEIDERRRTEGSLQLTLDAANMGSWDLDLRRDHAVRTLRHDQIFGYASMKPHWGLNTALEHFLPEDRPSVAEAFEGSRETGKVDVEARISRADDRSTRWLHITGQTFYDSGEPVRIAGVVADVTDRREVEERLRQAQKIEAIGQLTGGVAHDFNNLLMVISGGLEMMDRQTDPARRQRILAGMAQAVDRGSGLSKQLLAFSRRQALRPEPVNLARQIGAMHELLDRSLRGDVHVTTDFADDLWPVEVDPAELELVILNLAVNARDAMPEGGTIIIRGENIFGFDDSDLRGNYVRLSVIDSGTGMSPGVVKRVFEPFFTTKEIGKGSGLGLAQVHGFANSSGGGVRIITAPGEGTQVCLLLPRTSKVPRGVADMPMAPSAQPRMEPGQSGDVLLVEDDDEVAALTQEMIEQLGYHVTRAASAEAALGALSNGRSIDLVFSDVMMPGAMNGVDLAREIRIRRPGMPILLTSGYAEAAVRSADAEGVAILPKPFKFDDLAKAFAATRGRDTGDVRT